MELRNNPMQDRSNERAQSILAAARQHYAEVGGERFSTGVVAELAGCSIGSVYRYFPDKYALLDAIEPDRNKAEATLREVREILTREISSVTVSRENLKALIAEAVRAIDGI